MCAEAYSLTHVVQQIAPHVVSVNAFTEQEAFEKCCAHSPDVASGTVARRLRIDVHDANDNDDNDNA